MIQDLERGDSDARLVKLYEKNEQNYERTVMRYDSLLRNAAERERNLVLSLTTEQVRKADLDRQLKDVTRLYKRTIRIGRVKMIAAVTLPIAAAYITYRVMK